MMNKLDIIDIDILERLVRKEIDNPEKGNDLMDLKQYEFDLRQLLHKLEVMRND